MGYTPNTWVVGDVITAEKMNALEQAVAEASQGGGGYDLVIVGSTNEDGDHAWTASDLSVVAGSIQACEQKVLNDEPINAVVVLGYHPSTYNWSTIGRIGYFDCSYRSICVDFQNKIFESNLWYINYNSSYEITVFEAD